MINVTICGHDSHHPRTCNIEHSHGLSDYLLLLVKTNAWFYIDGKRTATAPGMVIMFDRNLYIHYGCDIPDYNDDWVHFSISGDKDIAFFSMLDIPRNIPLYPPSVYLLEQYFLLLTGEFRGDQTNSEVILDSVMHALLYSLESELKKSESPNASRKYYDVFCHLRENLYNSPAHPWSVTLMSNSLHLSISHFQHLYRQFFGLSCQKDIINARLEYAKLYLTESEMSIRNLANFCGYENELHFMKQFKQYEGMTPSEYRKRRNR